MQSKLQLEHLKPAVNSLQRTHGNSKLHAVYGAGCIHNPRILLLFMNPTATNISAFSDWKGLIAPWIGTKNIWKLLNSFGLFDDKLAKTIKDNPVSIWTNEFALEVYTDICNRSIYITNLAKCTQNDARPLKDKVFKEYLSNTLEEIYEIDPEIIISFGNQVSSILLDKKIAVSNYKKNEKENLVIKDKQFEVYPCYYPVGQGMRNIKQVIARIKTILN